MFEERGREGRGVGGARGKGKRRAIDSVNVAKIGQYGEYGRLVT